MILDLSHMADRSVRDSLELWDGPVIAEVGPRGGVLGVSLCGGHLREDRHAKVRDVVADVDHFVRITGDTRFVGIGSTSMAGLRLSMRHKVALRTATTGDRSGAEPWEEETETIMGGNWLRFLDEALPPGWCDGRQPAVSGCGNAPP